MISVCVATFNGEQYIEEQLASILASPEVGEVLVSDDGSTDGTCQCVRAFDDPRIRLIDGPRRGLVRNFEHLLEEARGEQIFLADQDDVWLPEKVSEMSRSLESADLVLSDCRVVDASLTVLHPSFFRIRGSGSGLVRNLVRNSYLGCCLAFRRSLLEYALPFPEGLPMHDWWLGLVAEAFGSVALLPMPLVLYRRHEANASSTAGRSSASPALQLVWRLRLASALAQRRFGPRLGARPAAAVRDTPDQGRTGD